MNKKIIFFAILGLLTQKSLAQKSVLLNNKFLPEYEYVTKMGIESTAEINFDGDEEVMKQLVASGVQLPMEVASVNNFTTKIRTGQADSKDEYPVQIGYTDVTLKQTMNGIELPGAANPLEGMRSFGKVLVDGKLHIDSVAGDGVTQQMKDNIIQITENIQSKIQFPKKPVKVGESFDQEVPLSMPVAGMQPVELVVKLTYTLDEIKKGKAYLSVVQNITMNFDLPQGNTEAAGSGQGTMVYYIKKQYVENYTTDMKMNMKIEAESMKINALVNMKNTLNTTAEKN